MTARRGFTLIEMLTTVAVLVIVLGLMVSLARDVRQRSAAGLTAGLLGKLDVLMGQYVKRYGALPRVTPLIPDAPPAATTIPAAPPAPADETVLGEPAKSNNAQFVRALRGTSPQLGKEFGELPPSMYDEVSLNDAWGSPIVLMPRMHPDVGMAPGNRSFFFSAGPDRRYLTRDDNLYSYDRSTEANEGG